MANMHPTPRKEKTYYRPDSTAQKQDFKKRMGAEKGQENEQSEKVDAKMFYDRLVSAGDAGKKGIKILRGYLENPTADMEEIFDAITKKGKDFGGERRGTIARTLWNTVLANVRVERNSGEDDASYKKAIRSKQLEHWASINIVLDAAGMEAAPQS